MIHLLCKSKKENRCTIRKACHPGFGAAGFWYFD